MDTVADATPGPAADRAAEHPRICDGWRRASTTRSIFLLVISLQGVAGCDPAYLARIDVNLRAVKAQSDSGVVSCDEAFAIVRSVARQLDFKPQAVGEQSGAHGWSEAFGRTSTEYGVSSQVTITGTCRQSELVFRISLMEFVASRESDFVRRIRMALVNRLIARFGDGAVRYYRGGG